MSNTTEDNVLDELRWRILHHLEVIYPAFENEPICEEMLSIMGLASVGGNDNHDLIAGADAPKNKWDETDTVLITYADTITHSTASLETPAEAPLLTLHHFIDAHLKEHISAVHILPFYPYSSDDGFSVIDYTTVNESHGTWQHIEAIAKDYKLMADLVINHVSARSRWFENYKKGLEPGKSYFIEMPPETDLSQVVRPRTSPLLTKVETVDGEKHVWCTFSADQVDMNFANPEVLTEFVKIVTLYLDKGVRWFRLDAVAFLWKELGSSCVHLPQTHEIIKLLRTLITHRHDDAVIITETNVPNRENLTYFGNANEAHLIYNFSLPPLMVHTLISEDCRHLKTWIMSMPPAQQGTSYLNFIASHDGIGVRPLEGLLSDDETARLLDAMRAFGGEITFRETNGNRKPYEINIALFDALSGTKDGRQDKHQVARFIAAHAIMLALEGIPAFYIHSLFATPNDHNRVEHTGRLRSINRHIWDQQTLESTIADDNTPSAQIFNAMRHLISVRKKQTAFHPNATQFTLHLGTKVFGIWRQSVDRKQSVFAIHNVTTEAVVISLSDINLIEPDRWIDLIANAEISDIRGEMVLAPYQSVWLSNIAS